jgi:hypothetical protein
MIALAVGIGVLFKVIVDPLGARGSYKTFFKEEM